MIQKTGSHHQLTLDLPLAPDSNDPFFKSDSHWPFQVVVKKYHLSRYIVCRFIQFDYYIWQRGGKGGPNHQLNYGFWSTFNRDHQDHFMLEFMREIQDVACFFGGFEGDFLKHMHQICGLVIFPHECFNQLHDLLEAWKLFKKRCRGSLMPRTGETSGFTYRRRAAGWSKMKIVTKHNPRSPRPRWSWSREKYRSSWARDVDLPNCCRGWSTRFRGGFPIYKKGGITTPHVRSWSTLAQMMKVVNFKFLKWNWRKIMWHHGRAGVTSSNVPFLPETMMVQWKMTPRFFFRSWKMTKKLWDAKPPKSDK